jgi:ribosomal protein L4
VASQAKGLTPFYEHAIVRHARMSRQRNVGTALLWRHRTRGSRKSGESCLTRRKSAGRAAVMRLPTAQGGGIA